MKYKILAVHNKYLIGGGEDQSFEAEVHILKNHGHEVYEYLENNERIESLGKLRTAIRTIWSQEAYKKILHIHKSFPFDVLYVQNFFPLLSPSIYYAAHTLNVPVIQFIRNYRLMCANSYFHREEKICELCLGHKIPFYGIKYACYKDSYLGSAVLNAMIGTHRILNTWSDKVDIYVALTEFARQKYIEGGFPAEKIFVKPNFLSQDPGVGLHGENFALFVGRLSSEKGIKLMLEAFQQLPDIPLKVIGDGPMESYVRDIAHSSANIQYVGGLSHTQVIEQMKQASFLVFPSSWYEGMPRTVIEAFAVGLPVVATNIGAMASMIKHKKNGLHFELNQTDDLISKVSWLKEHTDERKVMGSQARDDYENEYTSDKNYAQIQDLLHKAVSQKATAQ